MPLLSYGFGIVGWAVEELKGMDVLVRKVMREACSLHSRSAVECVYLPHCQGGRGVLYVEHLYHRRVILLSQHLQTSSNNLVKMCLFLDSLLPARKSVVVRARTFLANLPLNVELGSISADELKDAVCSHQQKVHRDYRCSKPLHGKFYSWCSSSDVDTC